jgi:hypothetical protein
MRNERRANKNKMDDIKDEKMRKKKRTGLGSDRGQ